MYRIVVLFASFKLKCQSVCLKTNICIYVCTYITAFHGCVCVVGVGSYVLHMHPRSSWFHNTYKNTHTRRLHTVGGLKRATRIDLLDVEEGRRLGELRDVVEPLPEPRLQIADQPAHTGTRGGSGGPGQARAAAELVRGAGHVRGWRRRCVGPDGRVTLRWHRRCSRSGTALQKIQRNWLARTKTSGCQVSWGSYVAPATATAAVHH